MRVYRRRQFLCGQTLGNGQHRFGDQFAGPDPHHPGTEDTALFCLFSDHEIIARVNPDAFEELDEIL